MWSLFGYAVIFVIVIIALHQLWFMRKFLLAVAIFGILGYFITNYVLRDADMSEGNVKKVTKTVIRKVQKGINKTNATLDKWEKSDFGDSGAQTQPKTEPKEDEGFVTE